MCGTWMSGRAYVWTDRHVINAASAFILGCIAQRLLQARLTGKQ